METQSTTIISLVERAEQYGKANVELYRLKMIDKSAEVVSTMATKLAVIIFFTLFFLILNVGIALWIGDLLGKSYLGFFSVAAFYAIAGILLYAFRDKWIKTPIRNSIILQALN